MLFNKLDKTDLYIFLGLFFIALFVSITSCLNPFGNMMIDADTSVYLTIARGITEGKTPYLDFFDNKGPILYLLNALGMFLGFTGVWIIQLIFLCISAFFAYKTALFFADKFSAFFAVVFSFLIFRMFFYEVAGPAEYSTPFVVISLFIFTKYYFSQKEPLILELIILGVCFSFSILMRINLFSLWLAFCLIIFIELIIKRKYLLLIKYILFFIVGISIVFIPNAVYLVINNALFEFILQNFSSGSSRAFNGFSLSETAKSFFIMIDKNYCFIPLIIGSFWIIKNLKSRLLFYYIGFMFAYVFSVFFHAVIRSNYDHYNVILFPFIVLSLAFFIQSVSACFSEFKYKKLVILLFLSVIFSGEILNGLYTTLNRLKDQSRNDYIAMGELIDQNALDNDEIISLGSDRFIYLFTKLRPASRYIYQLSGAEFYENTIPEFISDITDKKPAIIVIKSSYIKYNSLPDWYSPIYNMIDNDYYILANTNGYYIYKKIV